MARRPTTGTLSQLEALHLDLVENLQPHALARRGRRMAIQLEGADYFTAYQPDDENEPTEPNGLVSRFLTDFRKSVFQNLQTSPIATNADGTAATPIPSSSIFYIWANKMGQTQTADVVEIDVKRAYFNLAIAEGIAGTEFLQKYERLERILGKPLAKPARLKALGSLATRETVQPFELNEAGTALIQPPATTWRVHDTPTHTYSNAFFYVARLLGEKMRAIVENTPRAYFFWVDAIFCPASEVENVLTQIRAAGLEGEVRSVDWMRVESRKGSLFVTIQKTGADAVSTYQFRGGAIARAVETVAQALDELAKLPADKLKKEAARILNAKKWKRREVWQIEATFQRKGLSISDLADIRVQVAETLAHLENGEVKELISYEIAERVCKTLAEAKAIRSECFERHSHHRLEADDFCPFETETDLLEARQVLGYYFTPKQETTPEASSATLIADASQPDENPPARPWWEG